ncbi:hypothetical protein GGI23_004626, partial [Coemansia sp. RSA 2559]
ASQDLFGDFGDFLSAQPPSAAQYQQPKPATASFTASSAPGPAVASPTQSAAAQPMSPSKSTFDSDFIMSLYSKPTASQQQAAATSSGATQQTTTQSGQTNNSAFADLDILF